MSTPADTFVLLRLDDLDTHAGDADAAQLASLGHWRYDPAHFVLVHCHPHAYGYEVDLERCASAEAALDWIAQVAGKSWAQEEPACIGELVLALDVLLGLQQYLCGFGMHRRRGRINPRRVLLARHAELGLA